MAEKNAEKTRDFESSISRLEAIVTRLERGDATLDESLALFEEGTQLVKFCSGVLDAAEQRVVQLSKGSDGQPVEQEFEAAE